MIRELLADGSMSLTLIVLALYCGMVVASVLMLLQKRVIGILIRRLDEAGAHGEESAKTLSELGLTANPLLHRLLRWQLRGKTALSSLVFAVGETVEIDENNRATPVIRGRVDRNAAYFLPEPLRNRALLRYSTRGSHVIDIAVAVLAYGLLGYLLVRYLPTLIGLAEGLLGLS